MATRAGTPWFAWVGSIVFVVCNLACSEEPLFVPPDAETVCLPTTGCGEVIRDSGSDGADGGVTDVEVDAATDTGADAGAPDMEVADAPDLGPPDIGPPDLGPPDLGPVDTGCPAPTGDWASLGAPLNGVPAVMTPANAPSVITTRDLNVEVVWSEGTPADLHSRVYDGTAWSQIAPPFGLLPGNTSVATPKIARLRTRQLITWVEGGGGIPNAAYAAELNAGVWSQIGGGVLSTEPVAVTGNALLTEVAGPRVIVAMAQGQPTRIRVVDVQANSVIDMGTGIAGIGTPQQAYFAPALTLDPAGVVTLGFAGTGLFMRQRVAGQWPPHPSGAVMGTGGFLHSPKLASGNELHVFFGEFAGNTTNGYVVRDSGGEFMPVGSPQDNLPNMTFVTLHGMAMDSQGRPVIAYTEGVFNGPASLYVRRFDGADFVDLGPGPITGASGTVGAASLAVDQCDRPVVVFSDVDAAGERVLYVRRWQGG